jgi:hypothetical protein
MQDCTMTPINFVGGMFNILHPPLLLVSFVFEFQLSSLEIEVSNLLLESKCVETLPNFIARKHPRKGENKKQRARTKVQASKQLKRGMSH